MLVLTAPNGGTHKIKTGRGYGIGALEKLSSDMYEAVRMFILHRTITFIALQAIVVASDGYPELAFPDGYQLECLHGKDRIQAAREFLSPRNKWWRVDLYPKGIINTV